MSLTKANSSRFHALARRALLCGTALAGAALAVVGFAGAAQAQAPIKVGAFLSVTGPASFLGDPELKTLQHYVAKINADGGVLGRKLELVHYDDGGQAKEATTFAKRLIDNDKVVAIIGGSTTGTTMPVMPLVEDSGVPFISLAGAVSVIEPVRKFTFKTPHTDRMACERIFGDIKRAGKSKVAMISSTDGFGKSMQTECLKTAPNYGIQVLVDETYQPKDSDMTTQLTKIKNTAGVEAVINCGFGQSPAIVTRNYRQLGLTQQLYQSHGVASKEFIELAGEAAEGVRLPAAALLVASQLPDNDPQKPVVTGYFKEYQTKFGTEPSTFGGHAYDALFILVEAMKRAGTADDRAKVRDEIEKTKGFMGTGGSFTLSPTDHMGLDHTAFRMLEIRKGNWALTY